MKLTMFLFLLIGLSGCTTLEQRLARRIGCDSTKLAVSSQVNAPAYNQYNVTCEGKKYVCRDAPFYKSCQPDVETKKAQ